MRAARIGWLGLAAGLAVAGCTPREASTDDPAGADGVVTSMEVETAASEVRLTLHVTNGTDAPIELEFTSGQRFDFQVSRPDGEILWTWSMDKIFAQALGTETIPPGGSLRYSGEWQPGGVQGDLVATGMVTATNRDIRQSARFDLTGQP